MDTNLTDTITYSISKHCEERYTQRLLNKEDNNEIQRFIIENREKIQTDINKMIQFGDKIFTGKQSQKDGKGKVIDVYLKNSWVVLVDSQSEVVVTIYKVDLGCGDEFNQQYVDKMIEKLNESKRNLEDVQLQTHQESNMYRNLIDDSAAQINEYKAMIKHLEELCKAYQDIIDNNVVKVAQANREVAEIVNTLVNKREF